MSFRACISQAASNQTQRKSQCVPNRQSDRVADYVRIASDVPLPAVGIPVVDLDDIERVADLLVRHAADLDAVLAVLEQA